MLHGSTLPTTDFHLIANACTVFFLWKKINAILLKQSVLYWEGKKVQVYMAIWLTDDDVLTNFNTFDNKSLYIAHIYVHARHI